MSTQFKLRRGTAAQVAAFTGVAGETVVNTTTNRLVVQDGVTAGGFPHALQTDTAPTATKLATARTIATTGDVVSSQSFDGSGNTTSAATLATVNSNVGTFTLASVTVNAKGLITAASSGSAAGVTAVTGTAPISSSGGTTPAISIPAATTTTNGYMTTVQATALAAAAIDTAVVHLAGTETITGIKTLSATPVLSAGAKFSAAGWSVTETSTKLYFAYGGVNKASLDTSGNFIALGNVTAYGTP